jgi:TPR repeat protein
MAVSEVTVIGTLPSGDTTSSVTYFIVDRLKNAIVGQAVLPNDSNMINAVSMAVRVPSAGGPYDIGTFDDAGNFQAAGFLRVISAVGGERPFCGGHRAAARALAMLYLTGAGVPRDQGEAAHWLRVSAEAGDSKARVDLGNLLLLDMGGGEDCSVLVPQAAKRGHAYAQMMLGRYLARGLADERDIHQARMWLERAVGQGLAEANGDLATLPRPSAPLVDAEAQAARQ